jgi:hypothetical protein
MAPAYSQQRMRLRSKCKMPPDTPHAEPDCKRRRTEANADAKQGSVTQSKDPPAEAPPVSMSGMANPTCISVRARDPLDVTGRDHTDGGSWWAVSRPRERLYRKTAWPSRPNPCSDPNVVIACVREETEKARRQRLKGLEDL